MAAAIPRASWSEVRAHLAHEWKGGQHATLLGPTGTGKTHAACELLRLRRYSLVLAAKPRDPLLTSLLREGYKLVRSRRELDELPFLETGEPIHARVLYWPTFNAKRPLEEQTRLQAQAMRDALAWAYGHGGWTVLVDEALWFSQDLRLEKDLRALWVKGRSQNLSLVAAAQRPTHMPLYAYSQARFFFIWRTRDGRDLDRLAEISSGVDPRLLEQTIVSLQAAEHEALFFDSLDGVAGRVVAPGRPGAPQRPSGEHGLAAAAKAGDPGDR